MYFIYWTIISAPIFLILVYAILNLYRKIKVYEGWILEIKKDTEKLQGSITEVDSKNMFERDDEVGVVFEQIKGLVGSFNKKVQN